MRLTVLMPAIFVRNLQEKAAGHVPAALKKKYFFKLIQLGHPILAVQAAVLHSLGSMVWLNDFTAVKVGNGAGNLEYPVVRTGGEPHGFKGFFQQKPGIVTQGTDFLQAVGGDSRIARDIAARVTLVLQRSRSVDALLDSGGGLCGFR